MTKKAKKVPFDPKAFLATTNGGRALSKYGADQLIFSQGDAADAVFYIQKAQVKIAVVSERGEGSRCCGLGSRRILRRGVPDRTAAAPGYGRCNDRVQDYAAGEGGHRPRST
jgi:hypothetical protein